MSGPIHLQAKIPSHALTQEPWQGIGRIFVDYMLDSSSMDWWELLSSSRMLFGSKSPHPCALSDGDSTSQMFHTQQLLLLLVHTSSYYVDLKPLQVHEVPVVLQILVGPGPLVMEVEWFKCVLLTGWSEGRLRSYDRGEPAFTYQWTSWSSRLQENYRSF